SRSPPASFFFVFGQLGYFVGPVLGGPLLDLFGPSGLLLLAVIGLPISGFAGWQLRSGAQPAVKGESAPETPHSEFIRPLLGGILAIGLVAASQSWVQQNMITFLPKYLQDMGETPSSYGLLAALFMGGSAIGTIIGGIAADRFGGRRVVIFSMVASIAPLVLMAWVGVSGWLYLLIPLTGVLNGGMYTIIVVMAQRLIPGGMALASGLILGFLFSSGAVGTLFSGYLADRMGFIPVFYLSAAIALVGVLGAIGLQRESALGLAHPSAGIAGE
ncbi:MAG: MFS transporter, partial [Chloroflexi bacterium]|nr:MFS transporter [Chloroflexota bacterium]